MEPQPHCLVSLASSSETGDGAGELFVGALMVVPASSFDIHWPPVFLVACTSDIAPGDSFNDVVIIVPQPDHRPGAVLFHNPPRSSSPCSTGNSSRPSPVQAQATAPPAPAENVRLKKSARFPGRRAPAAPRGRPARRLGPAFHRPGSRRGTAASPGTRRG